MIYFSNYATKHINHEVNLHSFYKIQLRSYQEIENVENIDLFLLNGQT